MNDHLAFMELVTEPVQRRCWLLYRALENLPLDQAIDWAQRADDFILGERPDARAVAVATQPRTALSPAPRCEPPPAIVPKLDELDAAAPAAPLPARPAISAEQRQRLIDRLATGARNADLATEFGLSAKQVQGVRIGCAREIAARRAPAAGPGQERSVDAPPVLPASVEEIVRFLRQQDDVVVPQASGEFLVNARFRLQLGELVSRANRIRARQGKPEFAVANGLNGHATDGHVAAQGIASANGHAHA
ncbi:MAG TPA: hypothetical protein VME41_05565 [Stellaceae bacterium]|nr:hypothetical protein [Stellaceae bacterium]